MAERKQKIFTVRPKCVEWEGVSAARLIKGTRHEVECFLLNEFDINEATVEEVLALAVSGVRLEVVA